MTSNPHLSERAVSHIFQAIMQKIASGQDCFCMSELGNLAQYGLRTVQHAIPELERRNLITIERGKPGQPFRYRINQPGAQP
jgi:DNA-binding transcriptional regulator YhcF (GntR family)